MEKLKPLEMLKTVIGVPVAVGNYLAEQALGGGWTQLGKPPGPTQPAKITVYRSEEDGTF